MRLSVLALIVVMMLSAVSVSGFAEDGTQKKAKQTILLYTIGSDLETSAGMATYNLRQILKSSFSADEDINVVIMTGGSNKWNLDDDEDPENVNGLLTFPEDVALPDDAVIAEDPDHPRRNTSSATSTAE
ncbi:MAG: hypothetical protein IKF07_08315 [Eubacterium sp.]|nr:hypothetical protein [Eubacterium sp.]